MKKIVLSVVIVVVTILVLLFFAATNYDKFLAKTFLIDCVQRWDDVECTVESPSHWDARYEVSATFYCDEPESGVEGCVSMMYPQNCKRIETLIGVGYLGFGDDVDVVTVYRYRIACPVVK